MAKGVAGPTKDKMEGYADGLSNGNRQPGRSQTYNANYRDGKVDAKK